MRGARSVIFVAIVLGAALPVGGSVRGQNAAERELQRLEAEKLTREKRVGALVTTANRAAAEAEVLRRRLVAAAARRDALEREVERTEVRLIALRASERAARAKLLANRDALEDVVVALIAMERDRPPALAVRPDNAAEAARAAIMMEEVTPLLQGRAQQAAQDIARFKQLRQTILLQNSRYAEANTRLMSARQSIGVLIDQRRVLQTKLLRDAQIERTRIASLVRRSADLRDLVTRLGGRVPTQGGAEDTQAPVVSGFEKAKGQISYPALGQITTAFGASLDSGGRSEGVTIRTRRAAQVLSPYDGTIEFSGPFRSYGRVLIINVGSNYHIVLAGLSATYAEVGQEVLAGEPIGEMASDRRLEPDLYMEVRRASVPVNPALWLKRGEKT